MNKKTKSQLFNDIIFNRGGNEDLREAHQLENSFLGGQFIVNNPSYCSQNWHLHLIFLG